MGSKNHPKRVAIFIPIIGMNHTLDVQISNYLLRLKYSHGLKAAFDITSTYNEFQFCWLPEANIIAEGTEMTSQVDSITETFYPGQQVLYKSQVYRHSDPELIEALVSVVQKMNMSPIDPPKSFLPSKDHLTRKFGVIKSNAENGSGAFEWSSIPSTLNELKRILPDAIKSFYLLQDYHGGADGRVWLCMSEEGCICVLKFTESESKTKSNTVQELGVWQNVWACKGSRIIENIPADMSALLMPFAFHAEISRDGVVFRPFGQWVNLTDSEAPKPAAIVAQQLADSFEWVKFDMVILTSYASDPERVAEEALTSFARKGYRHCDIAWRHVALLPQQKTGSTEWTVQPIMIDVHRMEVLDNLDEAGIAQVVEQGMTSLKDQFTEQLLSDQELAPTI